MAPRAAAALLAPFAAVAAAAPGAFPAPAAGPAETADRKASNPPGPGAGPWIVEDPARHGVDSDALSRAALHLFWSPSAATRDCLVVVKGGVLIYEQYSNPVYNWTGHEGNSVTKTLGALLIGWAHTRGLLDIDADITEAYGVESPRPYPVTTRQVMSQAIAGSHGPGEEWAYDATGIEWLYVLPRIFQRATGRSPSDVWWEEFAKPLGLSDAFAWPDVNWSWAAGSRATCRDYARFGQLLLNQGLWAGVKDPVVSPEYVAQMHTPQTRYGPRHQFSNPCYGLLTWLNTNPGGDRGSVQYPGVCQMWPRRTWFPPNSPSDLFLASGIFGEEMLVVPSKNLVVVTMGVTPDSYPVERVLGESLCLMLPSACGRFHSEQSEEAADEAAPISV